MSQEEYRDFGPTLAAEYLVQKHKLAVSRETLRGWMMAAQLWRAKPKRVEKVHTWRVRRSRCGELVQWDSSVHDWLEGRGPKLYLISLLDDATSRLLARFVEHNSTEENMRVLQRYLEQNGRPLSVYTDKASLFANLPKTRRGELTGKDAPPLPPTQIGRALQELGIEWIAAHSPQAKGRIERGFGTAQDRLVKGLRVAGAKTLEEANAYLESEFLPWWNQTLTVRPASSDDAHRPLHPEHDVAASLGHVESRQVANDYTLRFENKLYQIQRADIRTGLRGGTVRVEKRLDGTLAVRFWDRYLGITECTPQPQAVAVKPAAPPRKTAPRKSDWMKNFHLGNNNLRRKASLR